MRSDEVGGGLIFQYLRRLRSATFKRTCIVIAPHPPARGPPGWDAGPELRLQKFRTGARKKILPIPRFSGKNGRQPPRHRLALSLPKCQNAPTSRTLGARLARCRAAEAPGGEKRSSAAATKARLAETAERSHRPPRRWRSLRATARAKLAAAAAETEKWPLQRRRRGRRCEGTRGTLSEVALQVWPGERCWRMLHVCIETV